MPRKQARGIELSQGRSADRRIRETEATPPGMVDDPSPLFCGERKGGRSSLDGRPSPFSQQSLRRAVVSVERRLAYLALVQAPHFPDLREYPNAPEAFLGGEIHRTWLLAAYPLGFFPWPDAEENLIWCNPYERMVFDPGLWQPPRRLVRDLRRGRWSVRFDQDFPAVIQACRTVGRPDGTWITDDLREAFLGLHGDGLAHSVEVHREGRLVGGLYGLSLGGAFFGESMFSAEPNASKVALSVLLAYMEREGMPLFDAQVENPHLVQLGGRGELREAYLARLEAVLEQPTRQGRWRLPEGFVAETWPPPA